MLERTGASGRRARNGASWRREFVAGLAALLAYAPFSPPAKPDYPTAGDALRSDWERLGADFRTVIGRGLETGDDSGRIVTGR